MTNFKKEVDEKLKDGFKCVFLAVHGSRAYALESKSSDYDVKFVYTKPNTLFSGADCLEFESATNKDVNYVGYSLEKFLLLAFKGNNQPYEWVMSLDDNTKDFEFKSFILQQFESKKKSLAYCYCGMIQNDLKEYETFFGKEERNKRNLKNILTATRSLMTVEYMLRYDKLPPLNFQTLRKETKGLFSENFEEKLNQIFLKKTLDDFENIDYDIEELKKLSAEAKNKMLVLTDKELSQKEFENFFEKMKKSS